MPSMREQLAARRAALEANPEAEPVELTLEEETELEEPETEEPIEEEVAEEPAAEEEPPAEEAPAEEPAAKEAVEKPVEAGAAVPEAFVPEFKYRANGADMEVPEFLRGIIKDKDSQEKVIKMLEKYEAFDTVSARRDQFRTERDQSRETNQKYEGAIGNLRNHVQRKDFDGFLKLCEIPEEDMLKWATEKAKYYMGDEQYRSTIDRENSMRHTAWTKESEANNFQSKYQDMEVRQLQTEFNYEMLKPEVSSFAASFDKFAGKQGSFIEEVRNRGELAYLREQKTIAPGEVIQGLMKQYATITQVSNPAQPAASTKAATKVVVKTAPKVPTIPTVRGTQASPTKEGFTSLDKIRQYRKDTYGK